MRFGVLGTGFWAKEVHAAALAAHPSAELVGVWGRDLAKAKAVGARVRRRRATTTSTRCWPQVDAVAIALPPDVQVAAGRAGRRRPASTCCWRSRSPWTSPAPTGVVDAVRDAGVASVVFFTFRFQPATSTWLEQAARTTLAGGHGSWLGSLAGSARSTPRPGGDEHGALWDIGPHALSLLVPALGPVVVGAGRRAGCATPSTWCSHHESGGRARTVTLSHTVAPHVGRASSSSCTATPAGWCCSPRPAPAGGLRGGRRRTDGRRAHRRHACSSLVGGDIAGVPQPPVEVDTRRVRLHTVGVEQLALP